MRGVKASCYAPRMKLSSLAVSLILAAAVLCAPAQTPAPQTAAAAPSAPASKAWFVRLIPPRATFLNDMTPRESALMDEHFAYWKAEFAKGTLIFGGPVLDPKGVFGVLVIEAATEDEARAIASADPSVKGGVNRIELAPMRVAFLKTAHDMPGK